MSKIEVFAFANILLGFVSSIAMPCRAVDDAAAASSPELAIPLLTELANKWSSIQTLQYSVEARDTESEGFKASIGETGHERDVLITRVTFMVKGADFGWKADTLVPATQTHERISSGSLSNGILSILFQGSQSLMAVTKNPDLQSGIPVTGCNPIMEAFSFLVSDNWQGLNCPSVELNSLISPDVWSNALKRISSISVDKLGTDDCFKVIFGPLSGNHDIVYFSKTTPGFPLNWQHLEGAYLRREVSVTASTVETITNGETFAFPVKIKRTDFYDPSDANVFCTSEQTLGGLEINGEVNDEDLIIDPSLADTIYDRDNDKRILIPK